MGYLVIAKDPVRSGGGGGERKGKLTFDLTLRSTSAGWTSVVGVVGVVDVEKAKAEAAESGSRRCDRIDRRRSCDSTVSVDAVTSMRVGVGGGVVVVIVIVVVELATFIISCFASSRDQTTLPPFHFRRSLPPFHFRSHSSLSFNFH